MKPASLSSLLAPTAGAMGGKRALPLAWRRLGGGGSSSSSIASGSGGIGAGVGGRSRRYHRVAATGGGGTGGGGGSKASSFDGGGVWGASTPGGLSLPNSAAAAAGLRAADEATAAAGPCITYWIGSTLYVAVTNRCNTVPLHVTRGPGFVMDAFAPLPPSYEPSDEEIFQAVQGALSAAHSLLSGPRVWTEVVFAGWGEPTLRWECVASVGERLLRSARGGGIKLRLNTNGLGSVAQQRPLAPEVAELFHAVTVAVNTADPAQYDALMRPNLHMRGEALALQPMSVLASAPTGGPTGLGAGSAGLRHTASTTNGNGGNGHGNVSVSAEASEALNIVGHFVRDCVAHGVRTQVTAVARPDVDVEAVKHMALRLGADFRLRPFFA